MAPRALPIIIKNEGYGRNESAQAAERVSARINEIISENPGSQFLGMVAIDDSLAKPQGNAFEGVVILDLATDHDRSHKI